MACMIVLAPQLIYADSTSVNDFSESVDSLTPLSGKSVSLGNGWELTADKFGWCRKENDPDVDNIIVARGHVKIQKQGKSPILAVDFSAMNLDELRDVTVTIERDGDNRVLVVAPSYSGLGMQLYASNIIKHGGSGKRSEITMISDFPWRFYPYRNTSNLILYPAFFRPVLTGISDGTFGWTGSFIDALEHKFEEGSLNVSIPFTVTPDAVSTVAGHEPVLLFNIGTWFGKVFGLPVESVPVVLSQEAGQSHARVKFDVSDVFGSIPGELLGIFSHMDTIRKVFLKINSKDKLKLATKKAIVWGDAKIVKYSSSRLSPLFDEHRTQFLKDIEDSKTNTSEGTRNIFKALGRFFAMVDNSEIDYDFINQDIALNPLYVQIGLFEAAGDFKGNIYAALSKRGDPAYYFIDTLGLDVTMPYEVTQVSAVPFFALEKIPLPENPFQIGLGVVELGGKISGMADPLYDVFHLAGKGGEAVDYSKWNVDAETEGTVALVDSLGLIMGTQEICLPWPLSMKTTLDFKLGNQNGIAGTGKISLFDLVEGKGSFHFFIGNNAKPIDFQAGLSANAFGVNADGTLSGYFDTGKTFHMKLNDKVSFKIAGHELAGLPFEMGFAMNEEKITLSTELSWGSYLCAWGHCVIHSGHKRNSLTFRFDSMSEMSTTTETAYGDGIYCNAGSTADHLFNVDSGNERVTISARCSPGSFPVFSVRGPDGQDYYMQEMENDGGAVVIDLNSDDVEIHPMPESGADEASSPGFIIDADTGTTLFVLEDPQPGQYSVSPAPESESTICIEAHVTAEMVMLSAADTDQQAMDINEAYNETIPVAFRSANTRAGTVVAVYARPTTFRNSTYDYWHEKLFDESSNPSIRSHLSDEGDYVYNSAWNQDSSVKTLGCLEAASHDLKTAVVPGTDLIYMSPRLTCKETTTLQRNHTSIKLGEFLISEDGLHQFDLQIGAHDLYSGKYQLLAKYENRKDADYIELPCTLTVHGDTSLPAAEITSVEETEKGEALIQWRSTADLSDIAMVRVFLHDHGKGDSEEVYSSWFDFNPGDPINITGLRKENNYSFSIELLKEATTTDDSGKTHALNLPGLRSETTAFTPQGQAFAGSPCVKLVDCESFAKFDENGDLFIRLRILNESKTAMIQAPVRIYYNHRNEDSLLAEFHMALEGLSYSDVHAVIPFEHISAIETSDSNTPSIVYDIETDDQNEHLTYDNEGIIEIDNVADFLAAKAALNETPILLHLKQGWNLVADAIAEDDIFDKLPSGNIYSHDGTNIQENVKNISRGGGYFVYLPKDANIVLTGTPLVPDFDNLNSNKWQLMGTGVDIYNTLSKSVTIPPDSHTYTPGEPFDRIFVLQRTHDGETQWVMNPAVIEAGSGFWCIKE